MPNSEICIKCRHCCRGKGFVYLKHDDEIRAAHYLGIERSDFVYKYCRRENNWTVLRSQENEDCVFLEEKGCKIYPARPRQCEKFPFNWPYAVTKEDCPFI